jgi:hypothetical protein
MLSSEIPTFTIPYKLGILAKIEHIIVITNDLMSKGFK